MFKKIAPLTLILFLRFFGLFIVLPVISIYALDLEGATPFLVGVVVGGYALTQALFQLPFGIMSDRIGRKPTLLFGLIIFLIGSLICAFTDNIYMLLLGRFLQGAGAIGSVITAMIADLVSEETRGKAMAIMGGSIGLAFAFAMGFGPAIGSNFGVDVLFMITATMAVIAMVLLFTKVPTPPVIVHRYKESAKTSDILKDSNILNMIIINGMQKALMSVAFLMIPIILVNELGWERSELVKAYLPAMIFGFLAMAPAVILGEKRNKSKQIFLVSILFFIISFLIMGSTASNSVFVVGVVLFFMAFNMMEPLVQSMISKFAKVHQKGAALGISNSVAYFMTFIGGTVAGLSIGSLDRSTIGVSIAVIASIWLLWTLRMQNPRSYSMLYIPLSEVDESKLDALGGEQIAEWYINESEAVVAIKYLSEDLSEEKIREKVSF
ncbi:MAG: MFS transporter [Sulfuricurvum sp.]